MQGELTEVTASVQQTQSANCGGKVGRTISLPYFSGDRARHQNDGKVPTISQTNGVTVSGQTLVTKESLQSKGVAVSGRRNCSMHVRWSAWVGLFFAGYLDC